MGARRCRDRGGCDATRLPATGSPHPPSRPHPARTCGGEKYCEHRRGQRWAQGGVRERGERGSAMRPRATTQRGTPSMVWFQGRSTRGNHPPLEISCRSNRHPPLRPRTDLRLHIILDEQLAAVLVEGGERREALHHLQVMFLLLPEKIRNPASRSGTGHRA